jgi:hypothetical protein
VVGDRRPCRIVDQVDGGADVLGHPDADRVRPACLLELREHLRVPKAGVRAHELGAARAGAVDACDQLVAEAQDPALRVRRPLPQAQMQHLAAVRAAGEDRVIAALARVAERGALLGVAVHLADEAVDIDGQAPRARAGSRRPRALERLGVRGAASRAGRKVMTLIYAMALGADSIEDLVDDWVRPPARSRARRERAERRRCRDPAAQQPARPAGAQHLAVVDLQALGERRGKHDPGVRDDPLVSNATCTPTSPTGPPSSTIKVAS